VVAAFLPASNGNVDLGPLEPVHKRRAQQDMVNAQTCIPAKGVSKVVPEGIDTLIRVEGAERIGPALGQEVGIGRTRLPVRRAHRRATALAYGHRVRLA
jgi:hypothetical protein